MWILAIILILALIYLFSLRCRKGHPGLKQLQGWKYAHRGLHDEQLPENSMAAFRAALESGYGIELDVHLLSDGNLAVMHDCSLLRTAGADVQIETLTTDQLSHYHLGGTQETIPTFRDVLDLFGGKVPMIIELKTAGSNYVALCDAVCRMLDTYNGPYCIESFDPRCIRWLKKNRPEIIRGQLVDNFLKSKSPAPWLLRFMLTNQLMNFLILPDFVAHRFECRNTAGNFLARKLWGVQGVSWTIRSQEDLDTAVSEGYLGIFEGFRP